MRCFERSPLFSCAVQAIIFVINKRILVREAHAHLIVVDIDSARWKHHALAW